MRIFTGAAVPRREPGDRRDSSSPFAESRRAEVSGEWVASPRRDVYGTRDAVTGNNRLALRRLTPNATGGLTIGPEKFITGQVQAAIPSVAITQNRTIGVFYYTCDGTSSAGFPIITAHFSTSTDLGNTFFDNTLESFLSPTKDNGDPRQRVLGDYMQVKAVDNTFYGGFAGNRVGFYPLSPFSITDPIFFKVQTKG